MPGHSLRSMYRTHRDADFPKSFELAGIQYERVTDLRYGTNPHQGAALYTPARATTKFVGAARVIKEAKGGLSQTNLEDIDQAFRMLKYMKEPAVAVMKHVNPSGVAVQRFEEPLIQVYKAARDTDPQAAFGSVVAFNTTIDKASATEIMGSFVEVVAAPSFAEKSTEVFSDVERFRRNKDIRLVEVPPLLSLPRYVDDGSDAGYEIRTLQDGSLLLAEPFLTRIRGPEDFLPAKVEKKNGEVFEISRQPTKRELEDLLFAWYVAIGVRSNGVVIAKNGRTLAVGTGQQDRVGAVQQAIQKQREKYRGSETMEGAVLASDGFFPFPDSVEIAARAGVTAFVQPGGSMKDHQVIEACNDLGVSMVFAGERCFSHH